MNCVLQKQKNDIELYSQNTLNIFSPFGLARIIILKYYTVYIKKKKKGK